MASTSSAPGSAAPTASISSTAQRFAGKLTGVDAFIGLSFDNQNVTAYVCDGAANKIGDNFTGKISQASSGQLKLQADNKDTLTINADASKLSQLGNSGNLTGSLSLANGATYQFSGEPAFPPAGLYLADSQTLPDGSKADGGWVVLNDGEVRGNYSHTSKGSSKETSYGHNDYNRSLSSGHGSYSYNGQPGLQYASSSGGYPVSDSSKSSYEQILIRVFQSHGGNLSLPYETYYPSPSDSSYSSSSYSSGNYSNYYLPVRYY